MYLYVYNTVCLSIFVCVTNDNTINNDDNNNNHNGDNKINRNVIHISQSRSGEGKG